MNKSSFRGALAALAVAMAGLAGGPAQAAYVLNEVARPGAASTALWDINNAGVMVGYSTAGTGANDFASAFVFDGTSYTSLTGPAGAVNAFASGISDGGVVVGSYNTSSSVDVSGNSVLDNAQGYIYQGGGYTTFNVAGALETFLRAISSDGRYLSGYYSTTTQAGVGFAYDTLTSTLHTASAPNSTFTIAQGINVNGVLVGSDILGGPPTTRPGFLYDTTTGTRTDGSIAGAFRTAIRAIADDGELAGWFIDAGGVQHGFVGSLGSYQQIDIAGADGTYVEGSNNARVLVGGFVRNSLSGAFIATPVAAPGTLALLALGLGALAYTGVRRRRGAA